MYTGHIGVGLAASRRATRVPIAFLLLASQGPDWIELVLARFVADERAQFLSHSILSVLCCAAVAAALYAMFSRDWRGSALIAGVYVTHPILDLATGSKPLWPNGPPVGACIYNHPGYDFILETAFVVACWWLYTRRQDLTRSRFAATAMLVALVACQGGVDLWQAIRIYRAPRISRSCDGVSPSARQRADTLHVAANGFAASGGGARGGLERMAFRLPAENRR